MVAEDLSGRQFGDLKIIGDTGKRNKNGMQIVIARDNEGNIHEYLASNIKNGSATGFKRRDLNKLNGKKWAKNTHEKIIKDGTNISMIKNNKPNNTNNTGYKYVLYSKKDKRWKVEFKLKSKKCSKLFIDFEDAVTYSFSLIKKYIFPLLNKKEQNEYSRLFNKKIFVNDYSNEKQKEIYQSLKDEKNKSIYKKIETYKSNTGLSFDKSRNKWMARIKINGKQKQIGRYSSKQEAKVARQKAVDEQIKILEKQLEEL